MIISIADNDEDEVLEEDEVEDTLLFWFQEDEDEDHDDADEEEGHDFLRIYSCRISRRHRNKAHRLEMTIPSTEKLPISPVIQSHPPMNTGTNEM